MPAIEQFVLEIQIPLRPSPEPRITAAHEGTLIHSKVINPSVVHSAFHTHFTNFMACHPSLDFLSSLLI